MALDRWRRELRSGHRYSVDLAVGSVVFSKSNPNVIYSGMGDTKLNYLGSGVLKSTNAGETWVRINNSTLPSPGTVSKVEVDPTNPDRVYVAQLTQLSDGRQFASGFFLSTNGGTDWRRTLAGLPTDLVVDAANPQTLYLAMSRVDGNDKQPAGLFRSVDGGNSWTRIFTSPYDDNATFDVRAAVTPANPQTIYIYTGGFIRNSFDVRVLVSRDGGTSWNNLGSEGLDTGQFGYNTYLAVDPTNANTVYVGARDVYKSTDGGSSWRNLNGNFSLDNDYTPNIIRLTDRIPTLTSMR
jgi:trimeric autotransporter adhesin